MSLRVCEYGSPYSLIITYIPISERRVCFFYRFFKKRMKKSQSGIKPGILVESLLRPEAERSGRDVSEYL